MFVNFVEPKSRLFIDYYKAMTSQFGSVVKSLLVDYTTS